MRPKAGHDETKNGSYTWSREKIKRKANNLLNDIMLSIVVL